MRNSYRNPINFYCVGAQKAGTTTLHDILIQHPDIFLPARKEARFFDINERYEKGIEWYLNEFFIDYAGELICGSVTPDYLYINQAPERLFNEFGSNLKLVFIFRNPIDRAFSHYLMSKRRLLENNSFEKAIEIESERIEMGAFENFNYSYINRGLYAQQLKRYLKFFPLECMHFINFEEDLIKKRDKTISQLLQFLGLTQVELNLNIKSNQAQDIRFKNLQILLFKRFRFKKIFSRIPKRSKEFVRKKLENIVFYKGEQKEVNPKTREKLKKYFHDDIKELELLTGKDFSNWN